MQLSILLLATDRASVQPLADALDRARATASPSSPDPTRPSPRPPGYSLVMIDQVTAPATVGDVVTMLRAGEQTATIPVLAVAQSADLEERIALLEAGADDVIAKPFDLPGAAWPASRPSRSASQRSEGRRGRVHRRRRAAAGS